MTLNKSAALLALAAFSIQAAADRKEPAYWMKKYPDAPVAKQQQCMVVAEAAYEMAARGGPGLDGFAVLAKGTAWEACMDEINRIRST